MYMTTCVNVYIHSLIIVYYIIINVHDTHVNVYIHLIDKCVLLYNYVLLYKCGHSFH